MSWLVKIDAELLMQAAIQLVTFLVFFVIVKKFFYDKINGIIKERKTMVDNSMDAAKLANEKAAQIEAQYKDRLTDIENERTEVLQKASDDAKQIRDRIIEDANQQAGEMLDKARVQIEAEKKRAEEEFKDSIVDLTIDAAEKVVGKSLSKEDHIDLINESISMLKEV